MKTSAIWTSWKLWKPWSTISCPKRPLYFAGVAYKKAGGSPKSLTFEGCHHTVGETTTLTLNWSFYLGMESGFGLGESRTMTCISEGFNINSLGIIWHLCVNQTDPSNSCWGSSQRLWMSAEMSWQRMFNHRQKCRNDANAATQLCSQKLCCLYNCKSEIIWNNLPAI